MLGTKKKSKGENRKHAPKQVPHACVCGGQADVSWLSDSYYWKARVECPKCGWAGPSKTTHNKAVAAWDSVMQGRHK